MDKNNLKIKNVDTISNTTSSLMPQKGGYLNNNKNEDINHLISMLSATSESNYTTNSTNTEEIKNKLLNILQDGGGREEYNELVDTFRLFIEYVILCDVKSFEHWERFIDGKYQAKIISILNNLNQEDKKIFLNELYSTYLTQEYILIDHPILLLIYNIIMSQIIDKSDLKETIQKINDELYNKISKIIIHYLTTLPKPTDTSKYSDQSEKEFLEDYYNMLSKIRDHIEVYLISYFIDSILKPDEFIVRAKPQEPQLPSQISYLKADIEKVKKWRVQVATTLSFNSPSLAIAASRAPAPVVPVASEASKSSKAPLRLSSTPATYTGQEQHRSLTPPRSSPRSSVLTSSRLLGSPASSRSLSEQPLSQPLSSSRLSESRPLSSIQQRSALSSSRLSESRLSIQQRSTLSSSRLSAPSSSRLSTPSSSRLSAPLSQPLSQQLSSIQQRSALSSSRSSESRPSAPYTESRPPLTSSLRKM